MKTTRRAFVRQSGLVLVAGLLSACGQSSKPTPAPTLTVQNLAYRVVADGLDFPEGPAFDPQGNLWCTELNTGNLLRLSDGKIERLATGGKPNSMAFDHQGRAWVCDSGQNAIRRFTPSTKQWEVMLEQVDGAALLAPNDLTFDPAGNLLFSCPNFASEEKTGYVVCLTPAGQAIKIASGYYRPNGLEIVDGGNALVIADTFQKTLFKGAWDSSTHEWKTPIAWCKVGGKEGPDGMTFGADGLLYQAIYGDGVLRVVNSEGMVRQEIPTGGMNPTNAAIDPSGKLGLVVTETEKGRLLSYPGIKPGAAIFDGSAWK